MTVAKGNINSELNAKRGPISCLGGNLKTKCLVNAEPAAVAMAAKRARIVGSIFGNVTVKNTFGRGGYVRSYLVRKFE